MVKEKKPVIGISIGDINGIGTEVIIKALEDKRMNELCTLVVYGSSRVFSFYRKILKINEFKISEIDTAEEAKKSNPNIINCWEEDIDIQPGIPTETAGKYAFLSLEKATEDLTEGRINALVTAPINKATIQSESFKFPGHTEYLAHKDHNASPLMLLVSNNLRVAVATGHIPVREIASTLTTELISKKIETLNKSLVRDFGITRPKIAVLGLNPHAGDRGLIGKEEEQIITPAISQVKTKEIFAFGPFPADGFFGSGNYKNFDGILAMYHDQGLVAMKSLSFDESVNYTAGLSFIRTSPDHGTAYDIVGKNKASAQSFRNAIYLACDIAKQRKKLIPEDKKKEVQEQAPHLSKEVS